MNSVKTPRSPVVRWFLPGRIDALLLFTLFLSICLASIPWLMVFGRWGFLPKQLVVAFWLVLGATFGLLTLIDFELMFASGGLLRRFAKAFIVSAIPWLSLSLSFSAVTYCNYRFNGEVFQLDRVILGVLCQRFVIVSGLALACVLLRTMTTWRLRNRHKVISSRDSISIKQLFGLTSSVAIAIASVQYVWREFPNDWGGRWQPNQFINMVVPTHIEMLQAATTMEVVWLLLHLLVPLLFTRGLNWFLGIRRWHWALAATLFVAWGVGTSLFAKNYQGSDFLLPVAIAHIGFAIPHLAVRMFFHYWGYETQSSRLKVRKDDTSQPASTTEDVSRSHWLNLPALNPIGIALAVVSLTTIGWAMNRYDLGAFLCVDPDHRLEVARKVASMSKAIGARPKKYQEVRERGVHERGIKWTDNINDIYANIRLGRGSNRDHGRSAQRTPYSYVSFDGYENFDPDLIDAIGSLPPKPEEVHVAVHRGHDLRILARLIAVKSLSLQIHEFDQRAFEHLMSNTSIQELRLHHNYIGDAALLESIGKCASLKSLRLCVQDHAGPTVELTPKTIKLLAKLPIREMTVRFKATELADFSTFRNLEWLRITTSPLDAALVSTIENVNDLVIEYTRIDQETMQALCKIRGRKLTLRNVEFATGTMQQLANGKFRSVEISNHHTIPLVDAEARALTSQFTNDISIHGRSKRNTAINITIRNKMFVIERERNQALVIGDSLIRVGSVSQFHVALEISGLEKEQSPENILLNVDQSSVVSNEGATITLLNAGDADGTMVARFGVAVRDGCQVYRKEIFDELYSEHEKSPPANE